MLHHGHQYYVAGPQAPAPPTATAAAAGGSSTTWTPDPSVGHLLHLMRKSGGPPKTAASDDDGDDFDFLVHLMTNRELNALVKAHNVILFCNQEQCPCVSNACQITADVMEDIRPFCLMVEECRELYAILSTPHIRVSQFCYF